MVHSMRQQSDQSVEEPFWKSKLRTNDTKHPVITTRNQQSNSFWPNDSWPNELINDDMRHTGHSYTAKTICLCCGRTFEPAQCSSYPLHSTVYCISCWCQHTNECRSIRQSIITLQRWWRGITNTVYHMVPTPTPDRARSRLQALSAGSMSTTSYSPLTPQHHSQQHGIESSPIKAHQVDWSKPAHSRYQQARVQSAHMAQPEDQEEWLQRQLHRFPKRNLRRSDRSKHSPDRWHPSNSGNSMDTTASSSVSEAELQLALQDPGPAEVQARAAGRQKAPTFAVLQPKTGRSVMPAHLLPEEMRLKSSSDIKVEASTRTRQSKISFNQQIKLDRIKTLAITCTEGTDHSNAMIDSAPPEEEDAQMQVSDVQRAITMSLEHFSKHKIEMDPQTETDADATATQHCSTCKKSKATDEFEANFKTCNKCIAIKRKRRRTKIKADDTEGKKLCSSKKWCPIADFTGGKKTCDTCIRLARALTKARKEVQYSVPACAENTTSVPDFQ